MTLFARIGTVLMLAAALRLPVQKCAEPPAFSGAEDVVCVVDGNAAFAKGWLFHEGIPPAVKAGDHLLFACQEKFGCLFRQIIEYPQ